ncbi:hypothetical protein [uncultured Methanobrevibacter sp.]|uniref:hypothetical protein n=1 Tax=uncultured Methanobrevibacter sp. TaxID=253161 RepID=UPI0025D562EF|nr:hypothetical protein [uncultured Methanobrevibacter sp.]
MEHLWFYIAIALAVSDLIHGRLVWDVFSNFYIVFGGMLNTTTKDNKLAWLFHELLEALFHFILISIIFLNIEIGVIAALIHLSIDICHTLFIQDMSAIQHRTLHFIIESAIFIIIFGF